MEKSVCAAEMEKMVAEEEAGGRSFLAQEQ